MIQNVMLYICIMDAILYQNNFLASTNTAKHDLKYISTRDISKMNAEPIIIIKSHFTIKGELNESEPLMLITEGLDNSFFCIFVRTIDNAMELKPKRKLTQQEVKKYKRIWQTRESKVNM